MRIFDVGTGSGNIAVSLCKNLSDARVTAVDISSQALGIARQNALRHGVLERIEFIQGDARESLSNIPSIRRVFDIIVSNPPYIPSGQWTGLPVEVRREPRCALDGGTDGLDFYRAIVRGAPAALRPGGLICFEIGDGQDLAVKKIFQDTQQFGGVSVIKDYRAIPRILTAELNPWKN